MIERLLRKKKFNCAVAMKIQILHAILSNFLIQLALAKMNFNKSFHMCHRSCRKILLRLQSGRKYPEIKIHIETTV